MYFNRFLLGALCLTLLPVFPAMAQNDRTQAGESRTLELVGQLKDVIREAESRRYSDPQLIQRLRNLVRRYDRPQRATLLYDDFRDGDYTANPSWVVDQGEFRVTRELGLRSVFSAPVTPRPTEDPPQRRGERSPFEIIGGMIDEMSGHGERGTEQRTEQRKAPAPPQPSTAEIYTPLRISNAFAVKLQMTSRGNPAESSRLAFGPYQGSERNAGYRLVYTPGKTPAFALVRISSGARSSIIEVHNQAVNLEDGRPHHIEWRRNTEGEMAVLLDGQEILRTSDRAFADPFDGFTIVNDDGDYAFSEIAIFGSTVGT